MVSVGVDRWSVREKTQSKLDEIGSDGQVFQDDSSAPSEMEKVKELNDSATKASFTSDFLELATDKVERSVDNNETKALINEHKKEERQNKSTKENESEIETTGK